MTDPVHASMTWLTAAGPISLESPLVMGILNITPDSFSDGGRITGPESALRQAQAMVESGAGILDVGGESTRPGAPLVTAQEEIERILPVVERLTAELDIPISIDTRKAAVAREALANGAVVVNDVSGLSFDPAMGRVVAEFGAGLVLMHMRGTPADMTERTRYSDLLVEVMEELGDALVRARDAGIEPRAVVVDPGIGFAKTPQQSFRLLRDLERLQELGHPVLVGPSRKSFLGALLGVSSHERVTGTAVTCALAWERGARIFRVHDVQETVQALQVAQAVVEGRVEFGGRAEGSMSTRARDPGEDAGVESASRDQATRVREDGRAMREDG